MRKRIGLLVCIVAGSVLAQNAPPVHLTLSAAAAIALKNHPSVAAAEDLSLAANQHVTETRSAYYPQIKAGLTASQANSLSRIGAGSITDPALFNRYGQGLELDQIVTDLGRTRNLVATSKLRANASEQSATAARYDVILGVNRAYFEVLQAQAFVKVAEQTVAARQALVDQVSALAKAQLKSQVDFSFASVNLSQAKLLALQANGRVQRAYADLTNALGEQQTAEYELDEAPMPPTPPADPEGLVNQAIQARPELRGLTLEREAARKFESAENDLKRPSVSLIGIGGYTPYLDQGVPRTAPDGYEAVAINVEIPIFNGHLFSARQQAAHYEALAADQRLRQQLQQVARDVRNSWISASTAYQRIAVSQQLLDQASLALDLAQGRYTLGLSSIVEITQAQLNLTSAQIENLGAKYDYQSLYAALQYTIGALR